jgi:hypothetical protein
MKQKSHTISINTPRVLEILQYIAPKSIAFRQVQRNQLVRTTEIPKGRKSNIGFFYWRDITTPYWILEREAEPLETVILHMFHIMLGGIVKYHPKEEAKRIVSKQEAEKLLEEKRPKDRQKSKRYYWKKK